MFKLVQCAKNTYYLDCFANTGVYDLGDGEAVLIDGCDHKKSYSDLDKHLLEKGLNVSMIINTHAHIDHITGDRFFRDKYGCEVYSSDVEHHLIDLCNLEGQIYFNGLPVNRERSYFFRPVGVKAKPVSEAKLPQGFEILPLAGHSFGMIGVKTPDNVWFLGDSVLSKETFESYKLPFFFDINKSIETLKMLCTLEGDFFVPAHDEPCADIAPLARYNAQCLERLKEYFLSISDQRTLEEIFALCAKQLELRVENDQYGKLLTTVKGFLQALIEDGKLWGEVRDYKLVYFLRESAENMHN